MLCNVLKNNRKGVESWLMIVVIFLAIAILLIVVFYPFFVNVIKQMYNYFFCQGMGSLFNWIESAFGMKATSIC